MDNQKPFNLYFPMLFIWILLTVIMLITLPFLLLFYLFLWYKWHGKLAILLFPMIFSLLGQLKGLKIDVKDKDSQVYISFI